MELVQGDLDGAVIRQNTLSDILSRTRKRFPNKLALIYGTYEMTYAQFDDTVSKTANFLLSSGARQGELFAVLSRNSLDFAITCFALARIGSVMVPINYMLTVPEIEYILQDAHISGYFASVEFAKRMDEAAQASGIATSHKYLLDVEDDPMEDFQAAGWKRLRQDSMQMPSKAPSIAVSNQELAHVLYTSGTESKPKGVMLSHENLLAEYVSCIVDGHMDTNDIFIHALPLYHSAQLHCFLGPSIYIGATGIILPHAAPLLLLETIETYHATSLFCPPTVWIGLLRHPSFSTRDLSSLQKCYYGAAIMPREVLKELAGIMPGARFWNFYGQTEVAPLASALQPEDQLKKLGSAGRPVLHVETRIVDEFGEEVAPYTIGEIVHRTPHTMLGYLGKPEKTSEAFANGWFHSGDLGYFDDEGYLTVVDRKKDMIKSGGVNVSSREVEEILYKHPCVSEVAVIGVPDDYWIEAVAAVVVCKSGETLSREDIVAFCKPNLSKFKIPKHVFLRDELPKNPSGKILKRELRNEYSNMGRSS